MGITLILVALVGAILALCRVFLTAVEVRGESMAPTLRSGDLVLAVRRLRFLRLRSGWLVLISGHGGVGDLRQGLYSDLVLKRIAALPGEKVVGTDQAEVLGADEYFVVSDNPKGRDSRHFGPIRRANVVGLILGRLPARARPWPVLSVDSERSSATLGATADRIHQDSLETRRQVATGRHRDARAGLKAHRSK